MLLKCFRGGSGPWVQRRPGTGLWQYQLQGSRLFHSLRDGAREEGLLPALGQMEGQTTGTGAGLAAALLLVPCCWNNMLRVALQQTMPALELAEPQS